MPLPKMPETSEHLITFWNRFQNRYKYRDQGRDLHLIRTMIAAYYCTISFIDYQIGRLLEYMETDGLLDNTLIVYTSDHGELLGDYNCYGKRSFLDSAARIPMIVRPAGGGTGRKIDTPVSLLDILPTFLGAAGVRTSEVYQGQSLLELIQ